MKEITPNQKEVPVGLEINHLFDSKEQKNELHFKRFFDAQIPERFKDASLKDFEDEKPELVKLTSKWVSTPCSLYIWGMPGVGKTHFVFALLKELLSQIDLWPRIYNGLELDAKLLQAIMTLGDGNLIHNLVNEDLLVIDDLGRETKTERSKRQLFEIINGRYNLKLPTIITSNLSPAQIASNYDEATCSRLQSYLPLELTGPDKRSLEKLNLV
jgi:DNA replication protein DnaC